MSEKPYRILIIEDSPEDREFYRRRIAQGREQDYVFWETGSGEEGLRLCREVTPDCVLLDYQLPDLDGLEFLDRFPAAVGGATIPIVMLTGHGNEAVAVQAMKKGAHDYLVKGLNSDGLRQVVQCGHRQGDPAPPARRAAPRAGTHGGGTPRAHRRAEAARGGPVRGEPAQGRVPGHARPRAAQPARRHRQCGRRHCDDRRTSETCDHSNDIIRRQTKHLSRLIDDLLDVSRINLGKIELRREVIDATPILESAVQAVKAWPTRGSMRCTSRWIGAISGSTPTPRASSRSWSTCSTTPPSTATTAGKSGSPPDATGSDIVISVKDTGVGIPPEKLPAMFELFTQGDRSSARSEGGLGIGLTVVKKLVEMHGGVHRGGERRAGKGQRVHHPPAGGRSADDGNAHRRADAGIRDGNPASSSLMTTSTRR